MIASRSSITGRHTGRPIQQYRGSYEYFKLTHYQHMFLRLKDGRILDPTADQFDSGLPAVYLGPMPDVYERWMKEAESG